MNDKLQEQVFKISTAMILINEHEILNANNVCISDRSKIIASIFDRLLYDGKVMSVLNNQNDEISFYQFNFTNLVIHPELGVIELDSAISKTIQTENPFTIKSSIVKNSIVEDIVNKTPNFTYLMINWLYNDPARGDKALENIEMIAGQFSYLNAHKLLSYYQSIYKSDEININDKLALNNFESRLINCDISASTNKIFTNGKINLCTEFSDSNDNIIVHNHYVVSNEHSFCSSNTIIPVTSKFTHETNWISLTNKNFIHPNHFGSSDQFIANHKTSTEYLYDVQHLAKLLFKIGLAPSLNKLLSVTTTDSIDYHRLLLNTSGQNVDLGVDYLIEAGDRIEEDNNIGLIKELWSIISQHEDNLDHKLLIDAFDKRGVDLFKLISCNENILDSDCIKKTSFFESIMARRTEKTLNDIMTNTYFEPAEQYSDADEINSFTLSL